MHKILGDFQFIADFFANKVTSGYSSCKYSKRFVKSFQNFVVAVHVNDNKTSTIESFVRIES